MCMPRVGGAQLEPIQKADSRRVVVASSSGCIQGRPWGRLARIIKFIDAGLSSLQQRMPLKDYQLC